MKRLTRILASLIVSILLVSTCFAFGGCAKEDIVKVELKISVFNYAENEWYDESETTITVDFYRHLAPVTVDTMIKYINDGYYNDAIFYGEKYGDKIFVGDLKMDENGKVYQNEIMPTIEGEFEKGTTRGSNLDVIKGNIALWRTWYSQDEIGKDGYNVTTDALHSGRATWFMPTQSISAYKGWFCVFAVIDMSNATNANTWERIKTAVMSDANSSEYTLYYTGEYDEAKSENNYGLDFHCIEQSVFNEEVDADTVFTAEKDQLVEFNKRNIKIANGKNEIHCGAKIVSAKVV